MASSDRPSGLTALAVIQFLFGTGQFFEVLSLGITRFFTATIMLEQHADGQHRHMNDHQIRFFEDLVAVPFPAMALVMGLMSLSFALFFVTGVGFLKRKRWIGRHAATAFVICELGSLAAILVLFPESYIRELGIGVVRMVFYPFFLLACVHFVFRRDLVR